MKFRKGLLNKNSSKNDKEPVTEQPIATLTQEELRLALQSRNVCDHYLYIYNTLHQSDQNFWKQIKQKYDIPDRFEWDPKTGAIFAKEEGEQGEVKEDVPEAGEKTNA
jgi:hypothetical protein